MTKKRKRVSISLTISPATGLNCSRTAAFSVGSNASSLSHSIAFRSAIPQSPIRYERASALRRLPPHCGQGTEEAYSSSERSSPSRSLKNRYFMAPRNRSFDRSASGSPLISLSINSSGSSFSGVFHPKPAWASSFLISGKYPFSSLRFSSGKPPSAMLAEPSVTNLLRSSRCTVPSPLQCGHQPRGELNEKVAGDGSSYEMPLSKSISFVENNRVVPSVRLRTNTIPSPSLRAKRTASPMRCSIASDATNLSITTATSWVLYRSSFIPAVSSRIAPSTSTFK